MPPYIKKHKSVSMTVQKWGDRYRGDIFGSSGALNGDVNSSVPAEMWQPIITHCAPGLKGGFIISQIRVNQGVVQLWAFKVLH